MEKSQIVRNSGKPRKIVKEVTRNDVEISESDRSMALDRTL